MKTLLSEDFSDHPVGSYPSDYFATQEYHYKPAAGYTGRWYEGTISNKWRPCSAAWMVMEDDGRHRMVATLEAHLRFTRILIAGDPLWTDYTAAVRVQPLKIEGFVGMVFRYHSNQQHYCLRLENGACLKLVKENYEEPVTLAEAPLQYDGARTYELSVKVKDDRIQAFVDGKSYFDLRDASYPKGRVGLAAMSTALFDSVEVVAEDNACTAFIQTRDKAQRELDEQRERYPKPAVWKKINTKGFGTGRQLRFGHLRGKKEMDIVVAQNLKLQPEKDGYTTVRCLTAVDLDGNVLWQFGEPVANAANIVDAAVATCDVPVQVYDIDGDGKDEVLCLKNFKLYILNGETGAVKNVTALPMNPGDENRYGRLVGDAIIIANFRGKPRPSDIVVKSRYAQLWAYDDQLKPLWTVERPKGKNDESTGHFPVPYDFDGDGRDDIFVGYTLFDCEGKVRWNHDWPDHTDEIVIGAFNPKRSGVQIGTASGSEGFNILDPADGTLLHRDILGHAQRLSAAKFREDLDGLQFYVVTYWNQPGIISLHACDGTKLFCFEPTSLGNILNPVNWTGTGSELALLSGSVKHGGMIDGHGRRVVVFPDDGHPEVCAESLNLTGDPRSEVALWDWNALWIYTQDAPFKGDRIYDPIRPPHYNNSNYRGESSLPRWSPYKAK